MDGYRFHCFKTGKGIAVRRRIKGIIYFHYEILSSSLCFCSPSLLDVGSFCMDPVWTLHQHRHHIVCSMASSRCFLRVSRNPQGWYDELILKFNRDKENERDYFFCDCSSRHCGFRHVQERSCSHHSQVHWLDCSYLHSLYFSWHSLPLSSQKLALAF